MKTTVEISDTLLVEARKVAAREGITLRTMIERGLHRIIAEEAPARRFKLREASFRGNGLQTEFRDASWEVLRDAIYRERGA